jgi:ribulose-phosphate 3-epimerase
VKAGVEIIFPHVEASYDVYRTLQLIDELGAKAGITLNPGSPAEWVEPLLEKIDYVLIMSVCPGFGGQVFQPESIRKIRALRGLLDKTKPSVQIAVDGGVSTENIGQLYQAGASFFVAGSSVFRGKDIAAAVRELRNAAVVR